MGLKAGRESGNEVTSGYLSGSHLALLQKSGSGVTSASGGGLLHQNQPKSVIPLPTKGELAQNG